MPLVLALDGVLQLAKDFSKKLENHGHAVVLYFASRKRPQPCHGAVPWRSAKANHYDISAT
jgi:hypothetical protein